ncbi:MAG: hypothetical protein ABIV26_08990 [Candidatus Limnocylindrales bacterium]
MRIFRSEAHVTRWLAGRAPGVTLPVSLVARLAERWWGGRLAPDWSPRTRVEGQAILGELGLSGPFWALG